MESSLRHYEQNKLIQQTVESIIKKQFPVETGNRRLEIEELTIKDELSGDDFPTQKETKLSRKTWQVPINASFKLIDTDTGRVIDKSKAIQIGYIPKITNRFTAIIEGNEYQTTNQIRRKSGVYARVKANGELENEFNLAQGFNFKMQLDPISQLFYIILDNRKYRLWTLLHVLGVSDEAIEKEWGAELLLKNKKGALNTEVSEMTNIFKKLLKKDPKDYNEVMKGLNQYFKEYTKVDPETTKITLGKSFEHVTPELLLTSATKLLNIEKGNTPPDDRDSLLFKQLFGVDDLLIAHFDKQKDPILRKIKRSLGHKEKVREIVSSGTFGKSIKKFFTDGDLSATPPQTNPVTIIADWRKTTPMGTGGIGSMHAITLETRDIHPSQLGFLDPTATPESGKVGVTVGMAMSVKKEGKNIKTPVINAKTGRTINLTPTQMWDSYVGFPDQYTIKDKVVKAKSAQVKVMYKGEADTVSSSKVDYYIMHANTMFSYPTNLVPFINSVQGNRAATGGRMIQQALGLDDKEAPLVQVNADVLSGERTFEDFLGNYLNPRIDLTVDEDGKEKRLGGEVTKITKDYINITLENGKKIKKGLYNNFPLNQDGFLHSKATVKVGDKVKWDTPLAENNYSSGRTLSLGKNLTVAYMPWKGYNFEDGAVITESASKKLTHSSMHKKNIFFTPSKTTFDIDKFIAWYPGLLTGENKAKLDKEGLPKIGETFQPKDVLAAYLEERELSEEEKIIRKISKAARFPLAKKLVEWDEEEAGTVIDIRKNGRHIDIYLKASHPFKEGDKLSGRYGNKSIVTKIIPDSEAPHRPDGTAVDIMINPHGVPGRMNIGQILETAAGKIAKKTGKRYVVNSFSGEDNADKVLKEMKELKIEPNETLTDGAKGDKFEKPIFVGHQYFMKLRHIVKKKAGEHSFGNYDINETPVGKGAQKLDPMLSHSLLAHGAKANLYEMSAYKGRANEEYWTNLSLGLPAPPPSDNFVFNKMINYMKSAGVNVKKEGNKFRIFPLTDTQVKEWSTGELKDPGALLVGKNLAERKGGLFDREMTGGLRGEKWSHIKLIKKIPNPMYELAITKLLGLTENKFNKILDGSLELDGKTGVEAIHAALKGIDVKKELKKTKAELKDASDSAVNGLNKKARYLKALKDLDYTADEAYMTQYLPVLPPIFRPVYPLPSGDLMKSDLNEHYRDIGVINNNYKAIKDKLGKEEQLEYDQSIYKAVKAYQGFIDPISFSGKKYKGVIKELSGTQVKHGLIHSSTWSKRQDLSARSTITVEPDLGIDEVGLPETMAKEIFKPFMIQKLVSQGIPSFKANAEVQDFTPTARQALVAVMEERPVLLNRAPSLHKHGIQAFRPLLIKGKAMQLNPIIFSGFNADLDGDTMAVHTPISQEAVTEAYGLLPSKIIFKHGDNGVVPEISQEYIVGMYFLSKLGKNTKKEFSSITEAKAAKLHPTDVFLLNGQKMTIGQFEINKVLPKELKDYSREMDKKAINKIFTIIGKKYKADFAKVATRFKELGNQYSHKRSFTISITDFAQDKSYRDKIVKEEMPKIKKLKGDKRSAAILAMTDKIEKAQDKVSIGKNNIYDMLDAGSISGGKRGSVRQILSMPGLLANVKGVPLKNPVLKSYGEGIDTSAYWNHLYAVRKGTVDRSVNTADSGALDKALIGVTRRLLITTEDCKTNKGIYVDVNSNDILDRHLASSIKGVAKKNDLVDSALLLKLKSAGLKKIEVRSALTCDAASGVCQLCYGLLPNGQLPKIGENVGVLESQAITERSTQLTMRTFHTGGAVTAGGGGVTEGFPRLVQLLEVPKKLKGKATLSSVKGTVKAITKNLVGGYDIRIEGYGTENDKTFTIPSTRKIVVKLGDRVTPGDRLTDGAIKPQELGDYKGHLAAQQYIVDEIDKIYGGDFHKKGIEVVLRGVSDNAEIIKAPDNSGYLRGDKASISSLDALNKDRRKEGLDTIKYKPYFKSIETLNVDSEDWLTRFYTNRIKSAIQEGASKAVYGDIAGKDPIPAYAYGDEFGKGDFY